MIGENVKIIFFQSLQDRDYFCARGSKVNLKKKHAGKTIFLRAILYEHTYTYKHKTDIYTNANRRKHAHKYINT